MTSLIWQRFVIQRRQRFSAVLPLLLALVLVTLACNILDQTDDRAFVIQNRLPTLTATRMPTLTPTGMPTPLAVAAESEAIVSVSPVATPIVEVATEPTASNTRDISSSEAPGAMAASVSASDAPSDPANISVSNGTEVQVTPQVENNSVSPSAINTTAAIATTLPTETALPTDVPTATPAATPPAAEWVFSPAQVYTDQYEDGLLLYGEVINNTGVAQELGYIFGTFYDAQGQIIADENSTGDFWPFKLIPSGERLPFGLFVDGIYSAASFDLSVEAHPSSETPHQNFEFSVDDQWQEDGEYCLEGQLHNLGDPLQSYVAIVMVLYDDQNKVISFGEHYIAQLYEDSAEQSLDFGTCADLVAQNVARHELRAWGQ